MVTLSPRSSRIALWFLSLTALTTLFGVVNYLLDFSHAIRSNQRQIELDGEFYYTLLIVIMPVILLCRHFETHHPKNIIARYSGGIVIFGFIGLIVLVNILNFGSQYWLEHNDYKKTAIADHKTYVRGERSVWVKADQPAIK